MILDKDIQITETQHGLNYDVLMVHIPTGKRVIMKECSGSKYMIYEQLKTELNSLVQKEFSL